MLATAVRAPSSPVEPPVAQPSMVCLDLDHPDIETFVNWKVVEEQKVAALVTGSTTNNLKLNAIMLACHEGVGGSDPRANADLRKAIADAKQANVPLNYIQRVVQFAAQGYTSIDFPVYDTGYESEAYITVSGQNSNNSVRVPNDFFRAVERGREVGSHEPGPAVNRSRRSTPPTSGIRFAKQPGTRPIPACSTTPPSTSGTRALPMAASTPATLAANTCSWMIRLATWPASTWFRFYDAIDRRFRYRRLSTRGTAIRN